ncbi:MAG TPA: hypothetical protein VE029_12195 [Rhizobacter sp.]|nr:hypothetical protein [Rhizobacter sp.]
MSLMDILSAYAQRATSTEADFDEAARQVAAPDLGEALASAFRSDRTPPFASMVQQLFGHSDSRQRAGLLTELLGSLSPAAISALAGSALSSLRAGSHRPDKPAVAPTITESEADGFTADEVHAIAEAAQQQDPGVLDRIGRFYGGHPQVVKSLGGAALAIALAHLATRTKS